MRISRIVALTLLLALPGAPSLGGTAEQAVFGPAKYNIKERYGKMNRFTASVPAAEGLYVIKVVNGEKAAERSDIIALSVNGKPVLLEGRYPFPLLASFVMMAKENTIELVMKDEQPSGYRRPPATPRNVVLSVLPAPAGLKDLRGTFGLGSWDVLKDMAEAFHRIKNPAAALLAMDSVSFHLDNAGRAAAVKKLSELKEPSAQEFYLRLLNDIHTAQEVRAEACAALAATGEKKHIPVLVRLILDPDPRVSTAAARGLSSFSEEDTQAELTKMIESLDQIRKKAAIRTIIDGGLRPINTLINLSASTDPYIANIAIGILGGLREPRATDHLLKMLQDPGKQDLGAVIRALGETRDPRVVDPLLAIAADPAKRYGRDVELADAFVALGDQRAAGPLAEMIKKPSHPAAEGRLRNAYRRLTGKEY
jgi:HEAT repeat protein